MKAILLILLGIAICAVGYCIGNKCYPDMLSNTIFKRDGFVVITCKMMLGIILLGFSLLTILGIFIPE